MLQTLKQENDVQELTKATDEFALLADLQLALIGGGGGAASLD